VEDGHVNGDGLRAAGRVAAFGTAQICTENRQGPEVSFVLISVGPLLGVNTPLFKRSWWVLGSRCGSAGK
jgi:hypothetical protein